MLRRTRKILFAVVLIRLVFQMCMTSIKNPKDPDVGSDFEFGSSFISLRIYLLLCYVPFVTAHCGPLQGENKLHQSA